MLLRSEEGSPETGWQNKVATVNLTKTVSNIFKSIFNSQNPTHATGGAYTVDERDIVVRSQTFPSLLLARRCQR
jgi:hypothetical protein